MTFPPRLHHLICTRQREAGAATAGVILLVVAGATLTLRQTAPEWPVATAKTEPFVETLIETGTINAQRLVLYGSTIPGVQAKLVEIAPEGQAVKAGDILARFDTGLFEQNRTRELAALRQAEAELVSARESARIEALGTQEDLDAALQQIGKAETGLANQVSGAGAVEVVEAEGAAADAERELQQTRTTYEDMQPLLKEGFITRAELERAEQALRRAEDRRQLTAARLEALVSYKRPAATRQAEAELSLARERLKRQSQAATARLSAQRADLMLAASRVDEIKGRIALIDEQIAQSTIRARGPGLVVYRDLFFATDRRKPQIGDEVLPNQSLIALPDASNFVVETRVREVDLHRVSASQKVEVRVDAYPDLRLPATVSLIGALAQEDAARIGTKFFPVTVTLTASDPRLRTGMSARVEIQVSSLPAAVVIPTQAVFDDRGAPYVVTLINGRPERQPVAVTAQNDALAAIRRGVSAGDAVLLVDPTSSR